MVEIEVVGNALCLDFANTVNARPVAGWDLLATASEAERWARAVDRPLASTPSGAELAEARELREVVFRVFEPLTRGDGAAHEDLDALAGVHAEAAERGVIRAGAEGYELTWQGPRTLRVLGWDAATSAVELLRHGPLDRLGQCPSCCWLFLDTSKNRRRRWCSMATCGSRDKARRYYSRHTT